MTPEFETNTDKLIVECDHRLLPIFQNLFKNMRLYYRSNAGKQ